MKRTILRLCAVGALLTAGAAALPAAVDHVHAAGIHAAAPRICSAGNLRITAVLNASGTTAGGYVAFRNAGATACRLSGWPVVGVQDANGHVLNVGYHPVATAKKVPLVTLTPRGVTPMQRAFARVTWTNWCGTAVRPVSLRVTVGLAKQTAVVHPATSGTVIPTCASNRTSSVMSVGLYRRKPPVM